MGFSDAPDSFKKCPPPPPNPFCRVNFLNPFRKKTNMQNSHSPLDLLMFSGWEKRPPNIFLINVFGKKWWISLNFIKSNFWKKNPHKQTAADIVSGCRRCFSVLRLGSATMTMFLTSSVFVGRQDDPRRSQRGGGGEARWHPTSGGATFVCKYRDLGGAYPLKTNKYVSNILNTWKE